MDCRGKGGTSFCSIGCRTDVLPPLFISTISHVALTFVDVDRDSCRNLHQSFDVAQRHPITQSPALLPLPSRAVAHLARVPELKGMERNVPVDRLRSGDTVAIYRLVNRHSGEIC